MGCIFAFLTRDVQWRRSFSGADPDCSESDSSHGQTFQFMIFRDSPFLNTRLDIDQKYTLIILNYSEIEQI